MSWGRAVVVAGLDVVDVAVAGGFVAAGGVLAVAVADLDCSSECPGERGLVGDGEDSVGGIEDDPFDVSVGECRHDLAGPEHGAVGEFADAPEGVFADEDRDQRSRSQASW